MSPAHSPTRESVIERHLLDQCRLYGFLCLKFVSPSRAGVPDRVLITDTGTLFIELKRPRGRLRKLQHVTHQKMRQYGAEIHTLDTAAGVDDLMNQLVARRARHRP